MVSLAEWREEGCPGVFTIRRNKGKGRVDYTYIEARHGQFEVRMVRGGQIFYDWHNKLELCGYPLGKQGIVAMKIDLSSTSS